LELSREFGKLGILSIGDSEDRAYTLYRRSVEILDREGKLFASVDEDESGG
jgi:hypothetical protein